MKTRTAASSVLILLGLASCRAPEPAGPAPLGAVRIGNQVWTASDLAVLHYRNGDPIPEAVTREDLLRFGEQGIGARMGGGTSGPDEPRVFYNWYAATDPRGIGPEGWRLPTDSDWDVLTETLGEDSAGVALMSEGRTPRLPGANGSGFDAGPHGYRGWDSIEGRGRYASWWTGTQVETDPYYAIFRGVGTDYPGVHRGESSKYWGMSIRLISDGAGGPPHEAARPSQRR